MRRKLIFALVIIPIGVLLTALAVINRQSVTLLLDPFSGATGAGIQAPLFLLLLLALALGLLLGGMAAWTGQGKWRRAARSRGREASELRRRNDRLERELESLDRIHAHKRLTVD